MVLTFFGKFSLQHMMKLYEISYFICEVSYFKGGGEFYDTLVGAELPKIAFSQLWPQLLMNWADFWYGGSILV